MTLKIPLVPVVAGMVSFIRRRGSLFVCGGPLSHDGQILSMNRLMGELIINRLRLFPLTPALSLGERENRPQTQRDTMTPAGGWPKVQGRRADQKGTGHSP
jgi:hypothetical protein